MVDTDAKKNVEKKDLKKSISYYILDLLIKYDELEKKARSYGTDTQIYNSEVHIISAIATHPGIHVAGLAELFGYTNGAISQSINKLEKKGLIRKETAADNLSKLSIHLTKKGELVHDEHMKYHSLLEQLTDEQLATATSEQIDFLKDFFTGLTEKLNDLEKKI